MGGLPALTLPVDTKHLASPHRRHSLEDLSVPSPIHGLYREAFHCMLLSADTICRGTILIYPMAEKSSKEKPEPTLQKERYLVDFQLFDGWKACWH